MTHPTEEQLVLFHYGESEDRPAIEAHLAACETCRQSFEAVGQVLAAVEAAPVPERGAEYGSRVWRMLEPKLRRRRTPAWGEWFAPRRVALAAALAAMLVVAFWAGTHWPIRERNHSPQTQAQQQVRERVLLVAVGDHLDRSQMVLMELENAEPGREKEVDISSEQRQAEDLVASNRLYRQTALQTGDAKMAGVLDELERALVEIANSPAKLSSIEFENLQRRIEAQGILFKVRVVTSDVRTREQQAAQAPARGKS